MERYKLLKSSPRWLIIGRENAAHVFGETSTGPGVKSLSCCCTCEISASVAMALRPEAKLFALGGLSFFFDKTNIAAPFDACDSHFREVVEIGVEAHVLL